jgi:hypothetical protein
MAKKRQGTTKKRSTRKRRTKAAGRKKGSRARKAPARKKRRKVTGGARRGALAAASTADLRAELQRREKEQEQARVTREQLVEELTAVERRIAELGGEVARPKGRRGPGRRRRGGGGASLPQVIEQVLGGKTMSVAQVAEAARAAGYRSSSENFRQIVNQTLAKNADRFKRVGRGQYTVK